MSAGTWAGGYLLISWVVAMIALRELGAIGQRKLDSRAPKRQLKCATMTEEDLRKGGGGFLSTLDLERQARQIAELRKHGHLEHGEGCYVLTPCPPEVYSRTGSDIGGAIASGLIWPIMLFVASLTLLGPSRAQRNARARAESARLERELATVQADYDRAVGHFPPSPTTGR